MQVFYYPFTLFSYTVFWTHCDLFLFLDIVLSSLVGLANTNCKLFAVSGINFSRFMFHSLSSLCVRNLFNVIFRCFWWSFNAFSGVFGGHSMASGRNFWNKTKTNGMINKHELLSLFCWQTALLNLIFSRWKHYKLCISCINYYYSHALFCVINIRTKKMYIIIIWNSNIGANFPHICILYAAQNCLQRDLFTFHTLSLILKTKRTYVEGRNPAKVRS